MLAQSRRMSRSIGGGTGGALGSRAPTNAKNTFLVPPRKFAPRLVPSLRNAAGNETRSARRSIIWRLRGDSYEETVSDFELFYLTSEKNLTVSVIPRLLRRCSPLKLVVIRTVAVTTTKVSLRWRRKSLRGVMTSCQVRKDLSLLSECLSPPPPPPSVQQPPPKKKSG